VSLERRLEGKVALVTGAASGNGLAIAERYAREGAMVVGADLVDPADGVRPGDVLFVRCDVTSGADVEAAVMAAVERFGQLDVVVANAGVNLGVHDLIDEPFEQYLRTVEVNQHGVWWTCREAARHMIGQGEGGRIIAVASIASLVGSPSGVAYNATKGAVLQLVRTLAAQLAPHGITVNAVCPGYVRTPMTHETQSDPALLARALAAHPLGRLGEPEDVAGACFFLASDDAAWVTGVALPVDGGYTCV
jgi:NAD(P)-dependent dehydrogenase (short-subunit alcohol dehydrogenase family)